MLKHNGKLSPLPIMKSRNLRQTKDEKDPERKIGTLFLFLSTMKSESHARKKLENKIHLIRARIFKSPTWYGTEVKLLPQQRPRNSQHHMIDNLNPIVRDEFKKKKGFA